MSEDTGLTSAQLYASGAMGNTRSSEAVTSGGAGSGMLPFEGKSVDFGSPSIDGAIGALGKSFEEAYSFFKAGASALGASISEVMGKISNYLGTQEAAGDNLQLTGIGPGEITNHGVPGVQSDLKLKGLSAKPSAEEGQSH